MYGSKYHPEIQISDSNSILESTSSFHALSIIRMIQQCQRLLLATLLCSIGNALVSNKMVLNSWKMIETRKQKMASVHDWSPSTPSAITPDLMARSFDKTILGRYACTRFKRYDGNISSTLEASSANTTVVDLAFKCLDLARRAPSGFNAQPYKLLLVHSPTQKKEMSKHCIGGNAYRVRDSDCTVVFLADREVTRSMPTYRSFLRATSNKWNGKRGALLKIQGLITMFSSGYPLPRILSVPLSFCVRTAIAILNIFIGRWIPLPSLSGAETWATKNTMLVAMAYMLGCTANGLSTSPMEGFNGPGIRKALKIPRRYSIPLIVSTGLPYQRLTEEVETISDSSDDVGMTHGKPGTDNSTPRYTMEDIVFGDVFGSAMV
jgi:nitroreductase